MYPELIKLLLFLVTMASVSVTQTSVVWRKMCEGVLRNGRQLKKRNTHTKIVSDSHVL